MAAAVQSAPGVPAYQPIETYTQVAESQEERESIFASDALLARLTGVQYHGPIS